MFIKLVAIACGGAVGSVLRLAVLVGLLGGSTTFSSYAWEVLAVADGGQWLRAAGYVLASNVTGLAAAFGGVIPARALYWA